jgi:hypothetical protein
LDESLRSDLAVATWRALSSDEAGGDENVLRVAKGDATFVLVELVQAIAIASASSNASEEVKEEVKRVLGSQAAMKEIEGSGKNGAGLLVEKIKAL